MKSAELLGRAAVSLLLMLVPFTVIGLMHDVLSGDPAGWVSGLCIGVIFLCSAAVLGLLWNAISCIVRMGYGG